MPKFSFAVWAFGHCFRGLSIALVAICTLLATSNKGHAWSESGHHIIAEIAFDQLDATEQTLLLAILAEHPRYEEDFTPPEKVRDVPRWRIGRTGYWEVDHS